MEGLSPPLHGPEPHEEDQQNISNPAAVQLSTSEILAATNKAATAVGEPELQSRGHQEGENQQEGPYQIVVAGLQNLLTQTQKLATQAREATERERNDRLALERECKLEQCTKCQENCQSVKALQARVTELENELEEEEFLGKADRKAAQARQEALELELKVARKQALDYEEIIWSLRQKVRKMQDAARHLAPQNQNELPGADSSVAKGGGPELKSLVTKLHGEENLEDVAFMEEPRSPPPIEEDHLVSSDPHNRENAFLDEKPTIAKDSVEGVKAIFIGPLNEDGQMYGFGEWHMSNGAVYKGQFVSNKPHGLGEMSFSEAMTEVDALSRGAKYVGEWSHGKMHGTGVFWYSDGSVYHGDFENGKRHGIGSFRYITADEYRGSWSEDKRHGRGSYFWIVTGARFDGFFVSALRNGRGDILLSDGTLTINLYRNDKTCGSGVTWSSDRSKAWRVKRSAPHEDRARRKPAWRYFIKGRILVPSRGRIHLSHGRIYEPISFKEAGKLVREIELGASSSQMISR